MKFLALALFPFVVAGVVLTFAGVEDAALRATLVKVEIEGAKVLALLGCVAAATAFERGEYLRRAWWLTGLCYGLLIARDIVFAPAALGALALDARSAYVQSGLVLVANLAACVGTLMIARAWKVAGLELPGSRIAQAVVVGASILIALTLTGPSTWIDIRRLGTGDMSALVALASDLGDILSLCLIAPVLLTAIALRGGLLIWPWALFTASMLSWLFFDAAATMVGHSAALDAAGHHVVTEAFRALACGFGFSAGLAQRFVIQGPADA